VEGSEATTRDVTVSVQTSYLPEQSSPSKNHWFFSYRIRIANHGDEPVKLLNRHWIITDALGRVEEVKGPGVVGKQPLLAPGQSFEYTSYCPLPTPFGSMEGSYEMVTMDGSRFEVEIARFALSEPLAIN
jgi:ApaG protein